jgi:uncharacterized membrane protein
MKIFLFNILWSLLAILAIDIVWLYTMAKRFYSLQIGHLMADTPKLGPAVVFYLLYTSALSFFVLIPAIENSYSPLKIFLIGAFFGLVAYGTYDLTNHSTLKNWPLVVTVVDLIWGALLTGVVSLIAVYLTKYFN